MRGRYGNSLTINKNKVLHKGMTTSGALFFLNFLLKETLNIQKIGRLGILQKGKVLDKHFDCLEAFVINLIYS